MFREALLLGALIASSSGFLDSLYYEVIRNNCTFNDFACRNTHCIPKAKRCDGHPDCLDLSDEEDCDILLCKGPMFFKCKNERCISASFVCDGDNDCEDYSDELSCDNFKVITAANATCLAGDWQCADRLCIPTEWVCNGESDCLDGSDETIGCTAKVDCDGFKCNNNHCIPNEWRCDGNDDCQDNSDEMHCEDYIAPKDCTLDNSKFLCSNNKTCIEVGKVCDGKFDCSDKSDESTKCKDKAYTCQDHKCSHNCVQLPSGPKCLCPKGFRTINDKQCEDINECEIYGICDQKCRNLQGSHECYCDAQYTLQEDKKTCKSIGEATLIFSSKTEVRSYLLQSKIYFPVAKNLKQIVGVGFDGHYVYWTDIFSEHESIVRSFEDGSHRELLVTSGLGAPEDLALDWLTGNIYFTDAEMQHIGVCTSDGAHCTVLINKDIDKPRGIVLNVNDGEMFWSDWGSTPAIGRSLMDGTKDSAFISNDIMWPNGLALDYPNQRLYWTDAKLMTLESINLDGTGRRIVLEGIARHPYAIAVFENRLYWSDWSTHSIQSCDKFTGKNHETIIKEEKDYIYGITIHHTALKTRTNNPCSLSYCSDICLLSGVNSYVCGCPEDKELSPDKHTCKDMGKKQSLVLGVGSMLVHIEHQVLGKHDITSLPLMVKEATALAYNTINNTIYVADNGVNDIIVHNLITGTTTNLQVNDIGRIIAMDFDYMSNNLYWCDETKKSLELLNLNTMSRKIVLHDLAEESPESIALVPEEGVMFISFKHKDTSVSHIDRLHTDGTSRTHVIDRGIIGPIHLHYDSDLHRIYFADESTGNIESTSVDGDDRHGFRALQTSPIGVTSLKRDVFWINRNSKRVFWAEKLNSDDFYNKKITIDLPFETEKMLIQSVTPLKAARSPCSFNNGNCSHICMLPLKHLACACPQGKTLKADNVTCSERVTCDLNIEFSCFKSNQCVLKKHHCDGKIDCLLGEDEQHCKKENNCPSGQFGCDNGQCIQQHQVCNSNYDCKDKSDEHNCTHLDKAHSCPPQHFRCNDGQCVSDRFVCDSVQDCFNGEDESNCFSSSCTPDQFRCLSGACIPKSWECDHEYDCPDLSDEHSKCVTAHCPSHTFKCNNNKCVDKLFVCDSTDDCGDNSDEISCTQSLLGNCNPDSEFACLTNTSICVPNEAKCNGTSECPHHEDEQNCSKCHVEEFSCGNGKCVPTQWLCDHTDDCGDGSDEKPELCLHPSEIPTAKSHVPCLNGFKCGTGHCIELNLVCDGVHNCYDGSDEGGACNNSCTASNNPCSHVCNKTPNGPMCTCRDGYKLMGNCQNCEDINECQLNPPMCSELCVNQAGSYRCDCYDGFMLRSDKKSCKANGNAMSMIFTSDNQIRKLSQIENSLELMYSEDTPRITGLDINTATGSIYFSIENSGTIHRINRKTKAREYIDKIGQPQKLAVDWISNNVYFVNGQTNEKSISVCHFDEMVFAKLITVDMHSQVSSITVDAVNKVLFYSITSWFIFNSPSFALYKTNLDGTGSHELVKSTAGYITGLTYDLNKKELYYLDQHAGQINRINYDGSLNQPIIRNLTRPVGLSFLEDHLYFLNSGGYMSKCKLFEKISCTNFKLHAYSVELFAISQESRQPSLIENACSNHTCSYLCVPSHVGYSCLCENGKLVTDKSGCTGIQREYNEDRPQFVVHSNPMLESEGAGSTVAAVLVPIIAVCLGIFLYYLFKKRHSGRLNISMRFHNPGYGLQVDEPEKSVLQPGQHEYCNPVELNAEDLKASLKSV